MAEGRTPKKEVCSIADMESAANMWLSLSATSVPTIISCVNNAQQQRERLLCFQMTLFGPERINHERQLTKTQASNNNKASASPASPFPIPANNYQHSPQQQTRRAQENRFNVNTTKHFVLSPLFFFFTKQFYENTC